MLDTLITNAKIVKNGEEILTDIGIKDGKFTYFGRTENPQAEKVVDAKENYVFPGIIDAHTHVSQKTGPVPVCDSYADASKAAAAGGTTTFLSFVFQAQGQSVLDAVHTKRALADTQAVTDYGFHIGYTDINKQSLAEFPALTEEGVQSIKMFMACGKPLMQDDGSLMQLFDIGLANGGLVGVHAENEPICHAIEQKLEAAGTTGMEYYAMSRPDYAEAEAVGRAIFLAEQAGAPLYVYHLTCKAALERIMCAKQQGIPVYTESCPHYLTFTEERYREPASYKNLMGPPLRHQEDINALWQGIADGYIDIISTDHCPYTVEQKSVGTTDFRKIAPGIPGIELLLRMVYTEGVLKGRISLQRMLEVLCYNPAKLFGLKSKGFLEIGKDADLVIFDAGASEVVAPENLHMKSGYSLMDGRTLNGKVLTTMVRGSCVFDGKNVVAPEGSGKFVPMNRV